MIRILLIIFVALLAGCSAEPQTGPGEVRWDREICVRCAMAVSDPSYSAQVRGGPAGGKSKLYKFDDIGCAVLWLEQQPWKDDAATELWVNSHLDGEWIDARSAWYVTGKLTPMDYGLGAQRDKTDNSIDFTQAVERIHEKEQQLNIHAHAPISTPQSTPDRLPSIGQ